MAVSHPEEFEAVLEAAPRLALRLDLAGVLHAALEGLSGRKQGRGRRLGGEGGDEEEVKGWKEKHSVNTLRTYCELSMNILRTLWGVLLRSGASGRNRIVGTRTRGKKEVI